MNYFVLLIHVAATVTFAVTQGHATRPLVKSTNFIEGMEKAKYFDLDDMLAQGLTGWTNESSAVQQEALNMATRYLEYRRSTRSSSLNTPFAEACTKNPASNYFCSVELMRIGARQARSSRANRMSGKTVADWLRRAEISRLRDLDYNTLVRGLGHFDEPAPLEAVTAKVLADSSCKLPQLAIALASKEEEFFPDTKHMDIALKLYTQGTSCSDYKGSAVTGARFRAALLSVWQGNCAPAEAQLSALAAQADTDGYMARVRYWRHYCAQVNKNTELANQMADELWKNHALSFQNLLVNGDDPKFTALLQEKANPRVVFRSALNPELNKVALGVEALMRLKSQDLASEVVDVLSSRIDGSESGFRLYMAALVNRMESNIPKFKVLATLFRDQPEMRSASTLKLFFPLSHFDVITSAQSPLDPYLVTALIRQESAFNSRARSAAGARGLMQLMPSTARQLGSRSKNALFDPKTNVRVGTKYFAHFLRNYNGDVELTLAAYNAGFTRVDNWLKRYPSENRMLFLDLIPFKETRDYVASIVRNYYWYVQIYSKEPLKTRLARIAKDPGFPIKMVSLADMAPATMQAH